MNDKARMIGIIRQLGQRFGPNQGSWLDDPFQLLIATILSQNTSDKNSHRAFSRLTESIDVKPEVLAGLKPEEIKPSIVSAGLSNIKSRRIVEVSREVLTRFGGNLCKVFELPLSEAREALMSIRGIGPKTADVVLSFIGGYPVMAVDTNIFRVTNRLGFAKGRNYERTRKTLESLIPQDELRDTHFRLIRLGREVCKPRKPLCSTCPVNSLCDYGVKSNQINEV